MLKLNREYTYAQICEELGWEQKAGNSKKAQIKELEAAYEFYHPENKKTHKEKKSYVFTKKIHDVISPSKENSAGNNKKNIQAMIDYIQINNNIADGKFYSWTKWYCKKLNLFDEEVCNIVYEDKKVINKWCKSHSIIYSQVLCDYVTAAKKELKRMFRTALESLRRRGRAQYVKSYEYIYVNGQMYYDSIITNEFADEILKYETEVCNEMNSEFQFSTEIQGRQLLFLIYRKKSYAKKFKAAVLQKIINNEKMFISLESRMDETLKPENNSSIKETSLVNYSETIAVKEIISDGEKESQDVLVTQIYCIISKRARKEILTKEYESKLRKIGILKSDTLEKEVSKIEKLLFISDKK